MSLVMGRDSIASNNMSTSSDEPSGRVLPSEGFFYPSELYDVLFFLLTQLNCKLTIQKSS